MVRYLVKTKEKKKCEDALKRFAEEFEKEYVKELSRPLYRPAKKYLPDLMPIVMPDKKGVVFAVPIKMPDFNKLQDIIAKFTGKRPDPKWKKTTVKNLTGYLNSVGVKFDSIEVFEE